jgi:diguanylate cyclase (GGDEF)-like protein
MKRIQAEAEYVIAVVAIILFMSMSTLSVVSLQELQGHSRIINLSVTARDAGQTLVKGEGMAAQNGGEAAHSENDFIMAQVDGILEELITGQGPIGLALLGDAAYITEMRRAVQEWKALKSEIQRVRAGAPPDEMSELSQSYFKAMNHAVSAAEDFSEKQVKRMIALLYGVNVIFIALVIVAAAFWLKGLSIEKRAELLREIAYVDPLTQIANRASCERMISDLRKDPPAEDVAVLMFDMNNLKLSNDLIGHQGGDQIIARVAAALREEAGKYGFVGRYGGDEFLAVFKGADPGAVESCISGLDERLRAYNALRANEIEKISYAAGSVIGSLRDRGIDETIHEADKRMYENKRHMKGRGAQF